MRHYRLKLDCCLILPDFWGIWFIVFILCIYLVNGCLLVLSIYSNENNHAVCFVFLLQVLAALGTEYFEDILPDIIRNCSHPKASVRDGYLTLFKVDVGYTNGVASFCISLFSMHTSCVILMELTFMLPAVSAEIIRCSVPEVFATGSACYFRW